MFLCVKTPFQCLNIRNLKELRDGEDIYPADGIALDFPEWCDFRQFVLDIESIIPEYVDTDLCILDDDHQNQMGAEQCPECSPFKREHMERGLNIDE